MFVDHHILDVNAFSNHYISRNNAVLYDRARFDDAASSDDGIFDLAVDQAAVGYDRGYNLAVCKILCRTGVVGAGV